MQWSWTNIRNLCKTGNEKNISEITLWFDAYHTLFSFWKAGWIFKFHLFICMYVTFFIITLFPIYRYVYSDYFPFIKSNLLLILHDSMVSFGSLTFLFLFFLFSGIPMHAWVWMSIYSLQVIFYVYGLNWYWYGAIVIVRLWNMFKLHDCRWKQVCTVKKQLCKFIYSIIQ